jgi:hypothetical protein
MMDPRSDVDDAAIDRKTVRSAAILLAIAIGVLCVGAAVDALVTPMSAFDPGRELENGFSMFALVSGGVLLVAAFVALRLALHGAAGRAAAWAGLALVFGWMAADETAAVHERVESALDVSWQLVFAPVIGLAAILWIVALASIEDREARALWLGGAAFWLLAQGLEAVKGAQIFIGGHDLLSGVEELLEIVGSSLLLLAALTVAATAGRASSLPPRRGGPPAADRPSPTSHPPQGVADDATAGEAPPSAPRPAPPRAT